MLRKSFKNQILLFGLLFAFWLIIAPTIDLVQIIVGGLVAFAITIYSRDDEPTKNPQKISWNYLYQLFIYSFKLI